MSLPDFYKLGSGIAYFSWCKSHHPITLTSELSLRHTNLYLKMNVNIALAVSLTDSVDELRGVRRENGKVSHM